MELITTNPTLLQLDTNQLQLDCLLQPDGIDNAPTLVSTSSYLVATGLTFVAIGSCQVATRSDLGASGSCSVATGSITISPLQ
jgi:hypothetical protein